VAAERGALGVIGDAQFAAGTLGTVGEQASEPLLDPIAGCRRRCDDERALAVDGDQLYRFKPDCEHAFTNRLAEQCAYPSLVIVVDGSREPEPPPYLVEVDADVPLPLAASLGEVALLE
jgi:hypothetical protein